MNDGRKQVVWNRPRRKSLHSETETFHLVTMLLLTSEQAGWSNKKRAAYRNYKCHGLVI